MNNIGRDLGLVPYFHMISLCRLHKKETYTEQSLEPRALPKPSWPECLLLPGAVETEGDLEGLASRYHHLPHPLGHQLNWLQ